MAKLDPKDPRNVAGNAPEVSEKDVKLGVYVFQPRNEADEPVGEKKFLASNDAAHVEAFLQVGYRAATDAEAKEYNEKTKSAREDAREANLADVSKTSDAPKDNSEVEKLQKELEAERQARADAEKKLNQKEEAKTSEPVDPKAGAQVGKENK